MVVGTPAKGSPRIAHGSLEPDLVVGTERNLDDAQPEQSTTSHDSELTSVIYLPWRNVDLDAGRLTVNQQIVSVEYQLIEDDLKTTSSRRTIDLDEQTVAMLRHHRRHQLEQRMATGRRGNDGFVFATPDGSPALARCDPFCHPECRGADVAGRVDFGAHAPRWW